MNDAERLAEQYLNGLDLGTVVFEPDGNNPPDLLLANTIAVEVRRLNQIHVPLLGTPKGLEEVFIPLWQRMGSFLPSLGPSMSGECWYVGLHFKRPIAAWKKLKPAVEAQLRKFMASPERAPISISVAANFRLDLFRSSMDHGSFFVLGAGLDENAGGWVLSEVDRNLRLCIAEKERKVAPYRIKYDTWWLVLSDHIAYAMDDEDREVFRSQILPRISHSFDKIVLLDPRGTRSAFET